MPDLTVPISEAAIRPLHIGDAVSLSGLIVTARDAAHKYMTESFIKGQPPESDREMYAALRGVLQGGVIYHCGPVVRQEKGRWSFVAAGPTTSIREEPYQADVIGHFGVRAVIGKGGMGESTLKACQQFGAAYLHAIGGAATLIAAAVKEVIAVYKLEFGVPEALWVIRVEGFPAVVTMDCHGQSIHERVKAASAEKLAALIGR
jgi:fumarate hydratase subunit beta